MISETTLLTRDEPEEFIPEGVGFGPRRAILLFGAAATEEEERVEVAEEEGLAEEERVETELSEGVGGRIGGIDNSGTDTQEEEGKEEEEEEAETGTDSD